MDEPKTVCSRCGVTILATTAKITKGLCLPCRKGILRQKKEPAQPTKISCLVPSMVRPAATFHAAAADLLRELEATPHVGNATHANRFELEAQRALLRHAIGYRVSFRLHDDHWGRTSYALLRLFEQGTATMSFGADHLAFTDLTKEDWREGTDPLGLRGGFLYRNKEGAVIYQCRTWMS